ncbi:hypothetical protein J5N97_017392 [Dioscorea zingiberensis]|uniref:RNA polymerase II subunit A C-terminal domain phosphatase SSU72 n=1 Tax=Dioscorea zingiberensis TaxID=325984 RepID=A0A9D5CLV4_9LILI|nr:hypothetical protein J5N97_017392 [Dioscorea zingiberensis]
MRLRLVCSSNQNRSIEAHSLLKWQGLDAASYGTGAHVKLPGPPLREPNIYDFGNPYKFMLDDLRRKDLDLYKRNGILPILKRNSSIKDNHEEAAFGAQLAPDLCQEIEAVEYWEESVDNIVTDFENKHKCKLLYNISF